MPDPINFTLPYNFNTLDPTSGYTGTLPTIERLFNSPIFNTRIGVNTPSAYSTLSNYNPYSNTNVMPDYPSMTFNTTGNGAESQSWLGSLWEGLGSDSMKGLGSIAGPIAALGGAWLNYGAAQDALNFNKIAFNTQQDMYANKHNTEVKGLKKRYADIGAMRNFSIAQNSDAVTPQQLKSWGEAEKSKAGLEEYKPQKVS